MIRRFNQSGHILILVFIALGVILFTVLFVIGGSQIYYGNSQYSYNLQSAAMIAEAGADKALASLNKTGGSYNGETETVLGDGSFSVTVTNKGAGTKELQVTSYIPSKAYAKTKSMLTIQATHGEGIAFNYGLQIGQGGLSMGNGATLNGSIYSNGNISGGNTSTITGDVYVAGGAQSSPNQETDCAGVNCQDYIFGKSVSGENRQDIVQSFKPSQTKVLNKVSLKLKKTGNPSNPTVRIMTDNSGKPNKNGILATGTLSADLVSNKYGFVDVTFGSTPNLTADTTYWIMIHTNSLDNSNYWFWSNDLAQSYTQGQPKWSSNWQASNPTWTLISGDLAFKTFIGGVMTSLILSNGSTVSGSVHANSIQGANGVNINGDAYYQSISNTNVSGSSCPNPHCYPGSNDPAPTVFPISDADISDWKAAAEAEGITNGSISYGNGCTVTLGPKKITGNVSFGNGCTVTIKSPVWIQGALSAGNTTIFKLDSSLGALSGVIVVDGQTSFGNGDDLRGSGSNGSYLMLLSTSSGTAINMGNSSISGIVYAPFGSVNLSNGASFKEIVADGISMGNSAVLNYDSGFASTVFSTGPSGSYSLIKGTYQVK